MQTFTNCSQLKDENGNKVIVCNNCSIAYKIEYDGITAPYNERGIEKCHECDTVLLTWKSRDEPYLVKA